MERISVRRLLTVLSLLVYLTTGCAGAHAASWCFGADGHAEFMLAPQATCKTGNFSTGPEGGSARGSFKADHCGPCLDVPAFFRARTPDPAQLAAMPSQAGTGLAIPADSPCSLRLALRQSLPRPDSLLQLAASSSLRHLTTIVLLN